jgi:hypothetical protein
MNPAGSVVLFLVLSAVGLLGVRVGIAAAGRWPRCESIAPGRVDTLRSHIDDLRARIDAEPPMPKKKAVSRGPGPKRHFPGTWANCQVCGRPLTDPTSMYRGVGPTCFARTRRYFP